MPAQFVNIERKTKRGTDEKSVVGKHQPQQTLQNVFLS